tara:strand:- start:42 stop:305 length:264 start_codon:yes stop_codon:yes gene_type:complete
MSIQIVPSEDLPKISNIYAAIRRNQNLHWEFKTGDANWSFRHDGSYKQACFLARRYYPRYSKADFGILYITKADVISYQKTSQQKLF